MQLNKKGTVFLRGNKGIGINVYIVNQSLKKWRRWMLQERRKRVENVKKGKAEGRL